MASTGDVSYPNPNGMCKVSTDDSLAQVTDPVMDNIKTEASITGDEFRDLKSSSTAPSTTTSTGQPLTYYHSLLYGLLSWEQPRATLTSYIGTVIFILAARYLPLLRWAFKLAYVALGFTASVEFGGQFLFGQGLASSIRPRKYYTIPKETTEAVLEDLAQLLDFALLEFQRVLFVENVVHSAAAFFAALNAYWLIKFLPLWGLSLITVTIAFFGPLTYMNNYEVIDARIEEIQELVNAQASQLKSQAEEHTTHAKGVVKQYYDEYSSKAEGYLVPRRPSSKSPEMAKTTPLVPQVKTEISVEPEIKPSAFPEAPKAEPVVESFGQVAGSQEPMLAA